MCIQGGDIACYCNFVETLDQHIEMGLTFDT